MYSAIITDEDLRKLRRLLTGYKPSIRNVVNKAIEQLETYQDVLAEKALHIKEINDTDFVVYIKQIISRCDEIFEEIRKENIENVYISVMPNELEKQYKKAQEKFPSKKVYLFDAKTISYKIVENESNTK